VQSKAGVYALLPTSKWYLNAKGRMGKYSHSKRDVEMPTKYDYLQAEIDGIRFVMPDMRNFEYRMGFYE